MKKRQSTGFQLATMSGIQVWNQAVNLLKVMVITRAFTITQYSTYTKMLLILDFAFAILVLNIPSAANYFVAKSSNSYEKGTFLYNYYWLCTITGIGVGVLLFFITPILSYVLHNDGIVQYRWYLLITPLLQIIPKATIYVLTSQNKAHLSAVISFISSSLLLIALLVVAKTDNSFTLCLIAMLVVEGIQSIVGYIIGCNSIGGLKNIVLSHYHVSSTIIKSIYKYAIPVGISSIILMINTRIDKLFVSVSCPDYYYAIYANASKELPISVLSVAASSVIVPKLVGFLKKNDSLSAIKAWKETYRLITVCAFLLLAGVFVFAPEVMKILYSEKYSEGISIFRIYLFLIPFHCINYGLILNALGKTKYILGSSVISLILNLILDFVFFQFMGVIGLGVATIISAAVMAIVEMYFSSRLMNTSLTNMLQPAFLLKISILNIVFAVVFSLIERYLSIDIYIGDIGEALLLGTIWSLLYLGLMFKSIKRQCRSLNSLDSERK